MTLLALQLYTYSLRVSGLLSLMSKSMYNNQSKSSK